MQKPEDVLTKSGVRKFHAHLFNMEEALLFLTGHASDLELDSETIDEMNGLLYKIPTLVDPDK